MGIYKQTPENPARIKSVRKRRKKKGNLERKEEINNVVKFGGYVGSVH